MLRLQVDDEVKAVHERIFVRELLARVDLGALRWPPQLRRVKRLEGVECLGALLVDVPLGEAQDDRIRREVGDGKAVLFDRLHFLVDAEMNRRRGAYLAGTRRPAA